MLCYSPPRLTLDWLDTLRSPIGNSMNFKTLIAPLTREEFFEKYRCGECMVIRGTAAKFSGLITLDEVEVRLNDGANFSTPVEIIAKGERRSLIDTALAWSQAGVRKNEVLRAILSGHSFLMRNSSQINPRVSALLDTIENELDNPPVHADVHIYVSTSGEASAYNAHRDFPQHKLYLQAIGATRWCLYAPKASMAPDVRAIEPRQEQEALELVSEFDLEQGDLLYMPPAVFHKVSPRGGPRVSLSIPFNAVTGRTVSRMDRTYIPFRELFERSVAGKDSKAG